MSSKPRLPKPVVWAHAAIKHVLREGDLAIDATVGNGFDTLWLAQIVGKNGKVFGFDLQPHALATARTRLHDHGIEEERVTLFLASHAELAAKIPESERRRIRAITFNLGYLPGGDKAVTTQPDSTLLALDSARSLLPAGGLLSVIAYPGHSIGSAETQAVEAWMNTLSPAEFEIQHLRSSQRQFAPPQLWLALRTHTPHASDPIP